MHSIVRDEHGRFVPVVRPKRWNAASVERSRDRSDRIARARTQGKEWLTTTQWMSELDRLGHCRAGSDRHPVGCRPALARRLIREAFAARMVVKQVLHALADYEAPLRDRLEARNELYRR